MGVKLATVLCLLIGLVGNTVYSGSCYAETPEDGVCKSPSLEVTRYKWEGNNWKYIRDYDSKTFEIDDITFRVSLDETGVTVNANSKKLIYIDYRKYFSDLEKKSKPRKGKYTTLHNFQGKKVLVRILNFATDLPINGGFRWCVLEIYVESTKSSCESAGGTLTRGFPPFGPLEEITNEP